MVQLLCSSLCACTVGHLFGVSTAGKDLEVFMDSYISTLIAEMTKKRYRISMVRLPIQR